MTLKLGKNYIKSVILLKIGIILGESLNICRNVNIEERKGMKNTRLLERKASILMNFIGIILCVVFIPMLILNLIFIVGGFFGADFVPSYFGYRFMIEGTTSMETGEPSIFKGDLVIFKANESNIAVGDEIAVLIDNTLYIRTVKESNEVGGQIVYILTAGDQTGVVQSVLQEQVLGKYVFNIRHLGSFMLFVQSTWGIVLLIGGPAVAFFVIDLCREVGQRRKLSKEKSSETLPGDATFVSEVTPLYKTVSAEYFPKDYSPKTARIVRKLEEGIIVGDLIMDEMPDGSQKISFSRRVSKKNTKIAKK